MAVKYSNNASTTLASSITSSATSLTVSTGTGALFPTLSGSDFFFLTLVASATMEIVKVTAVSGDTFTVVRGQDGTTPAAFSAGAMAAEYLTKGMFDQLKLDAVTDGLASNRTQPYDSTILKSANIGSTVQAYDSTTLKSANIGTTVQAWDADLDSIAALTGTSGFAKKTAANTWSLDTNLYVSEDSATGSAYLPTGTTAQRTASPTAGLVRYNSTTQKFEGYGSAWGNLGGGAAIGDTAPANPGTGDLWWNSLDGHLYVYYGSIWVDAFAGGEGQYLSLTGGTISGNLSTTGNVIVGTGSTGARLQALGAASFIGSSATNNAEIRIQNIDTGGSTWRIGDGIATANGNLAVYRSGGTPAIVVDTNNILGFGVSSPSSITSSTSGSALFNGDICVLNNVTYPANNYPRLASIGNIGGVLGAYQWAFYTGGSSSSAPTQKMLLDAIGNLHVPGGGGIASNEAFGTGALKVNTTGSSNVAVGYQTLNSNTTGTSNVAVGYNALQLNTTAGNNTGIGNAALASATTGGQNTAAGSGALYKNVSGSNNCAFGQIALYNNLASYNTALGTSALSQNTTGSPNTAVGYAALSQNISGTNNVAVGDYALAANTANGNTAVGSGALSSNVGGSQNTANGYLALQYNTTGVNNTATGTYALYVNNGSSNTASGTSALQNNTTGSSNSAHGVAALISNTSGSSNTAIGTNALYSTTTGSGNTGISPQTSLNVFAPVFNPITQDNRFCCGSTAVTNAYINVAWTVVSDARDKTNIEPLHLGLDFVTKLDPVEYQRVDNREDKNATGPVRYGFLAQDILAVEGDKIVVVDNEDPERLKMNDSALIAILVKAIQELTTRLEALEAH